MNSYIFKYSRNVNKKKNLFLLYITKLTLNFLFFSLRFKIEKIKEVNIKKEEKDLVSLVQGLFLILIY